MAARLVGATWMPDAPKGRVRPVLSGGAGVQWIDYRVAGLGTRTAFLALHTNAGIAW